MHLPKLARDLDRLSSADAVVADSYLRHVLNKSGLCITAGLVALLGLASLGISAFWFLEQSVGPVGAAALVGILSCALAAVIFVFAAHLRPGREFSLALDLRRSAIQALEEDLSSSTSPETIIYPASEALISAIVVPLLASFLRGLKSSKPATIEPPEAPPEAQK